MMRVSLPLKVSILALAALAPFFFPITLTAILGFIAALIFPPIAVVLGTLIDLLYSPSNSWPIATIAGSVLCLVAVLVRSFVKARIMY